MTTPNNDGPTNDEPEMRALLGDAVSDVHPTGTSDDIRARVKRPSAARGWLPVTVAAAVATVLVIGGTSWLAQRDPSAPAASPGTAEADPAPTAVEVPAYYLGATAAGPRLFKETHALPDGADSELQAAVEQTISGRPLDPDYTAWRFPVTPTASLGSDRITIDLAFPAAATVAMPADPERLVEALVRTAQDATGTKLPVLITVDGSPGDLFGVDTLEPLQPTGADTMLAPVSIATPTQGATVGSEFEVTGQASAFEANVVWELRQGDRVVRTGFATAKECCTLSPYEFTVTAEPGDYTLVVRDTDESDGEGVGVSQDTKEITVE